MAIITATPRPDILLSVLEDSPDLAGSFIYDQVFPQFRAHVSAGEVPKTMRRNRIERLKRARYGEFPRGTSTVTSETFSCDEQGFEEQYDNKDIEIYGGEDRCQRVMGARALLMNLLSREYTLASTLFNTTTFGAGYNTAGAAAWDNASGAPLDDVAGAKDAVLQACGREANTMVIGAGAKLALDKNAQMQSQVRAILGHTSPEGVRFDLSIELLKIAFGLEKVLVGKAHYDTADEGQTASISRVWSDDFALVCYTADSEDDLSPQLGRTFTWDEGLMGLDPDVDELPAGFAGMVTEHYYETNNTGIVRARDNIDQVILNKEAAHLLTDL